MPEQHYRVETYPATTSIIYLLRRLHEIWVARFEAVLAETGLTLTQWMVLNQLRDGLERTASTLATCLQHDSGALTRVIDQLEHRKLIARRRSARDRRVVELALTEAGRSAVVDLLPAVVEQTNLALASLSRDEVRRFKSNLIRLIENAQEDRFLEARPSELGRARPVNKLRVHGAKSAPKKSRIRR